MEAQQRKPPRIAFWILRKILPFSDSLYLKGDFEEEYFELLENRNVFFARMWFWLQVLKTTPDFLKNNITGKIIMFKNYVKIAFRNIIKQKTHSLINIFGLAIGIACCLLIMLYVQYELSYDKYHEKSENIYRVTREYFNSDGTSSLNLARVAYNFAPNLKTDYPQIKDFVRLSQLATRVRYEDKVFFEQQYFMADENVFSMFSWSLEKGNTETVLQEPNTLVLSSSMARKYFGDAEPIGKTLEINTFGIDYSATVTGVFEDIPLNSHVHPDFILSDITVINLFGPGYFNNWGINRYLTYILVEEGFDPRTLDSSDYKLMNQLMRAPNNVATGAINFQKLHDIHLHSHLDFEVEANSDIVYIYTFSTVAFLILVIACFNFMNLSTARSAARAKEVGLRKVVGAIKKQLIAQFLGESVLLSVISLCIAMLIVFSALPAFNSFANLPLSFNFLSDGVFLAGLIISVLFVGILAGSYPAFFLSSFTSIAVLKGVNSQKSGHSMFRTFLVVGQFAISIMLLIGLGVINRQLDFIQSKNLGFDKEHVITFGIPANMSSDYDALKKRLLDDPNILAVTASDFIPSVSLLNSSTGRIASGDTLAPINFMLTNVTVDHDYFNVFSNEMAAGRNFSNERETDIDEAFIINETAARKFGWQNPIDAVDKAIQYGGKNGKVIGIVKDFHFESLHRPIVPIIFYYPSSRRFFRLTARVRAGNVNQALDTLSREWSTYNSGLNFNYTFLDEDFDNLYRSEQKLSEIFQVFSGLAVLIGCLGLFGLVAYTVERRTKEIGVRKVLGASTAGLTGNFSFEFVKLVAFANILAWPVAYLAMNQWLQSFAYRADLNIWVYFQAGFIALVISIATVSYHSIKAATSNPIKALRYE